MSIIRIGRKIWRQLYFVKVKDRLKRVPRHYAIDYDRHVDRDTAYLMERMAIRDPAAVQRLYKKYGVTTPGELMAVLPKRRRAGARRRFNRWMNRITGATPYEPVVKPFIKQMIKKKVIHKNESLIHRSSRVSRKERF